MVLQNFPRFKRFCIGQVRCKYATAKSSPCFWLSGLHLSFMIHSTLDCSDSRTHVGGTFITSSQPLPLTNERLKQGVHWVFRILPEASNDMPCHQSQSLVVAKLTQRGAGAGSAPPEGALRNSKCPSGSPSCDTSSLLVSQPRKALSEDRVGVVR